MATIYRMPAWVGAGLRRQHAARQLLEAGTPPKDEAKNLGVSVPTHYRWLPTSARD